MKSVFSTGKRSIAFALAAAMLISDLSPISAAEVEAPKVIGVKECGISNDSDGIDMAFVNEKGEKIPYYYTNSKAGVTNGVSIAGNALYSVDAKGNRTYSGTRKDGFFYYNGVKYLSADYVGTMDYTYFSSPVEYEITEEELEEKASEYSGFISIDGKLYANEYKYYQNVYYYEGAQDYALGNYEYKIVDGVKDYDCMKDPVTGLYFYNGKYYKYATYIGYNSNKLDENNQYYTYTRFYDQVEIVDSLDDIKSGFVENGYSDYYKYYSGSTKDGRVYYTLKSERFYTHDVDLASLEATIGETGITTYSLKKESNGLYKFGDRYFEYAYLNSSIKPTYITYSYPVTLMYNTQNDYTDYRGSYDKTFEAYKINGLYRDVVRREYSVGYITKSVSYNMLGVYDSLDECYEAKKQYIKNEVDPYYEVEGVAYKDLYVTNKYYGGGKYKYYLMTSSAKQISFGNKMKPSFSWSYVSLGENNLLEDGKQINVGYELMVDDQLVDGNHYKLVDSSATVAKNGDSTLLFYNNTKIDVNKYLAEGEGVKFQVRAVYYVIDNELIPSTAYSNKYYKAKYRVIKTGEWSDPVTYTRTTTNIGKINDLAACVEGTEIKLTWTPMQGVKNTTVYQIDSTVPLNLTADNIHSYINKKETTRYYDVRDYQINANESFDKKSIYSYSGSYYDYDAKKMVRGYNFAIYKYHYYVARIDETYNRKTLTADTTYSNVAGFEYIAQPSTPTVEGFRVEYDLSGSFALAWDKKDINTNVVVYAYESKDLPKYFNMKELSATSKVITAVRTTDEMRQRTELTTEVFDMLVDANYIYIYQDSTSNSTMHGGIHLYNTAPAYLKDGKFYTDSACKREIEKEYVHVASGDYELTDGRIVKIEWQNSNAKNYIVDITKWATREDIVNTRNSSTLETALSTYCQTDYDAANTVFRATASLKTGRIDASSFKNGYSQSLKTGRTYYFVAYTYDGLTYDTEKPSIASIDGMEFTYYNDFSAPSNVLTAKPSIGKTSVNAIVTKNSIRLTISSNNSTGYTIYRKTGKGKYKKLVTTTNNEYTDKKVKLGKEYTYKVIPYNYDPKLKIKTVGKEISVVSATPSSYTRFMVEAKMQSKSSVKLTWSKLARAKKYEIYRTATDVDRNVGESSNALPGKRWKLIKTVKKAKTTSYIDKNLKEGASYNYIVVAYYKDKKVMCRIARDASISLKLSIPKVECVQKGNTAKLTWNANKLAAGYEVSYTLYDEYDNPQTNVEIIEKTSKSSFVIKNIPKNGYVTYGVRAYSKDNRFTGAATGTSVRSLPVSKSISAKYDSAKEAVLVSWKPVEGAAYYMVYRSLARGVYDEETKSYWITGATIAAEANDDESNDRVSYREYHNVTGSILGTSAYDYYKCESDVTYYYTVTAYGENGRISSVAIDGKHNTSPAPAAVVYKPTKLSIKKISKAKKGAKLTFKKVEGAQSYVLLRATKKNGKYKVVAKAKGNASSIIDKKAKKGKTYFYKLRVVKTNGLLADRTITSAAKKCKIK